MKEKCIECGAEADVKQLNMFDEYYCYCHSCYDEMLKKDYKEMWDLE